MLPIAMIGISARPAGSSPAKLPGFRARLEGVFHGFILHRKSQQRAQAV
jgi:hypothetical protein